MSQPNKPTPGTTPSDQPSLAADGPRAVRALTATDQLMIQIAARLAADGAQALAPTALARAARDVLGTARQAMRAGAALPTSQQLVERAIAVVYAEREPELRHVINATGVILNTNLGRAPLSAAARAAISAIAQGYSNLEFDLEAGTRGSRQTHVRHLLTDLTGAEDALVVNNNAAAVLVVLSALAGGREVITSRGELVEIGGGFRVPDVMRQGGARLVEVGTTNRTRVRDFGAAITPESAALLSVHPSNFRIVGFTESPALADLAALAHDQHLALIHDLGSGCLLATERWGLAHEPTPRESIMAGADVVCFSGDKLLGGPQAGVIVGRAVLLARIAAHPLMRAVRIDKLTLAALEATLRHYRDGTAEREIPIWQAISASVEVLATRAEHWAAAARGLGILAETLPGESTVGGGSLPGATLATVLCTIAMPGGRDPAWMAQRLRHTSPPVAARTLHARVLLDPRTVMPEEDSPLLGALEEVLAGERRDV